MIYDEPRIRSLGDCYVAVEFADTVHLRENFRLQAVAQRLTAEALPGVVEVIPHLRSLAVVYDRAHTSNQRIVDALREVIDTTAVPTTAESRLFRLPVWYDDPWSAQLAEKYEVPHNLQHLAEVNGVSVQDAVAMHTGTDFWVAAVGFVPGCFWAIPLDMSKVLTAPKYAQPRDYTPSRTMALAGLSSTIYPYDGPGGYQCIGRCAVSLYQFPARDPIFPDDGILVQPGDRHRYVPVDALEYERIRAAVRAGTYEFDVTTETVDLTIHAVERENQEVPA